MADRLDTIRRVTETPANGHQSKGFTMRANLATTAIGIAMSVLMVSGCAHGPGGCSGGSCSAPLAAALPQSASTLHSSPDDVPTRGQLAAF